MTEQWVKRRAWDIPVRERVETKSLRLDQVLPNAEQNSKEVIMTGVEWTVREWEAVAVRGAWWPCKDVWGHRVGFRLPWGFPKRNLWRVNKDRHMAEVSKDCLWILCRAQHVQRRSKVTAGSSGDKGAWIRGREQDRAGDKWAVRCEVCVWKAHLAECVEMSVSSA